MDDVALVLDIPAGTVKSRLARARDGLRQILEQLTATPSMRENTINDLEQWASSLRDVLSALHSASGENPEQT